MAEVLLAQPQQLPVGPIDRHGLGFWGVGTLIATEAALFGYLLFSYYYIGASAQSGWLLERSPSLKLSLPDTILLLASSAAAWFGETGILMRRRGRALVGFGAALIMGVGFALVQGLEWQAKPF